ncbi:MAG: transposase [Bdellovibrionota bacterium]
MKQLRLLQDQPKAYGGDLLKTRKGRAQGRPLDTRNTMHLVLRSSKAQGVCSFRRPQNMHAIERIVKKFAKKYGVKVLSLADVHNHLHFQIKLSNRFTYRPFIRAITAAIAMAVSGVSRWKKAKGKFWDYRPFTRVVKGIRGYLSLRDYIEINQLEGAGIPRLGAEWVIRKEREEFG